MSELRSRNISFEDMLDVLVVVSMSDAREIVVVEILDDIGVAVDGSEATVAFEVVFVGARAFEEHLLRVVDPL